MNPGSWTKKKKTPKFPKAATGKRKLTDMTKNEIEKKLDSAFSKFIRYKYSGNGYVRCYTCGAIHAVTDIDNGHYLSRALRWTRWDERNCRPQCAKCNRYMNGQHHVFRKNLVEEYGDEIISQMEYEATDWGQKLMPREWMLEKLAYYRKEVRRLEKE